MAPKTMLCSLATLALLVTCATTGSAGPSDTAAGEWRKVPPPPVRDDSGRMESVKAFAPDDVWVGGAHEVNIGSGQFAPYAVMRHWDGQQWESVPLDCPNGECPDTTIDSIDGVATNDIWAVGQHDQYAPGHPVLQHWDGARWSNVPVPDAKDLQAVHAVATDDVWLVGSYGLVRHWDGKQWTAMELPPEFSEATLRDVTATGPDDVWVVGDTIVDGFSVPITAHWDGQRWSNVELPPISGRSNILTDVVAGDGQVWAAASPEGPDSPAHTFHITRGGITANKVEPWGANGYVGGMVLVNGTPRMGSDNDLVWNEPVVEWRGDHWEAMPAPPLPPSGEFALGGLGVVPGTGEMWAVGRRTAPEPGGPEVTPFARIHG